MLFWGCHVATLPLLFGCAHGNSLHNDDVSCCLFSGEC
jgi:hypothetical protein